MTAKHLKYALVNMLDNECEDCDTCEEIETDLNNAMERLDNHLQEDDKDLSRKFLTFIQGHSYSRLTQSMPGE